MPGDKVPGRQLLIKQTSTEKAIQRYDKSHVSSSSHSAISVWHLLIHECALIKCVSSNQDTWKKDCLYTCQLSRLRVENFDLTPAHACGPISHAWLKNVSCCRLAWHNFQKYVNSDPCKERKPCVKWINGNTFLAISDFWSEKHWERARLWQTSADFGRLRKTSEVFGILRTSSGIFGNDRVVFKNPSIPRIKISRLYLRKSWQVYI